MTEHITIESIQIAELEMLTIGSRNISTGIVKQPVPTAHATVDGLVGDHIGNPKHHGGPGQAVYLYSAEDYSWWETELDQELRPGLFGENLTLSSFGTNDPNIGDRYKIGEVTLEVTSCRIPCDTFSARIALPNWIRRFRDARRPGCYTRVINAGQMSTGDAVERIPAPDANVTVLDTQDLYYGKIDATEATLRRFLAAPVADRNREDYESQLAKLTG